MLRGIKFAFKIKNELVTQAMIIIGLLAFSSVSLATIVIYLGAALTGIICPIVLVVIVYLALCLTPC